MSSYNKKKYLLIIGDSWACGEWHIDNDKKLYVAHRGITEYFSPYYDVINLSRGYNSLWQILYTLENFLNKSFIDFGNNKENKILVFQTDPLREKKADLYDIDFEKIINPINSLEIAYRSITEYFYLKLSHIASKFNTNVHLSGGLTDVDKNFTESLNHVSVVEHSWIKLLHKDHIESTIPLHIDSATVNFFNKYNKHNLAREAIDLSISNFVKLQDVIESEYFGPVYGDFHPSRKGHRLFVDKLLTRIEELPNVA